MLSMLLCLPVTFADKGTGESLNLAKERQARELAQEILTGRKVCVRVYNNWKKDPKAYKLVTVKLDGLSFQCDAVSEAFGQMSDSAVIVVTEQDQTDEAVALVLDNFVYAELYALKKGKNFDIWLGHLDIKDSTEWFVSDALGLPLTKAIVEIFIRGSQENNPYIYLSTATTDEQGQVDVPDVIGSLKYLSFIVSKPDYGTSLIDNYIYRDRELVVPFVSRTTEAYRRSIYGIVMDPEGNPVAGAVISCSYIRTLGEGLINPLDGWTYTSITDDEGAFSLYLPNENIRDDRGYLIPPKSQYHVRIEAPKELGLVPYVKPIENGHEALIFLERSSRFRTFVFEDVNGPITNPEILRYISVAIKQSDGSRVSFGYDDFKNGGIFPLGEYHAVRRGMDEFDFESLTVNEQSPDELIFKLPECILYHGRIVHGLTGEPMEGAFVIGFNAKAKGNLSMITDQQWQALHALPNDPCLADPTVKPVCQIYHFKKIVRTDELGNFQMSFRPGEIYGFIAFQKDYLGLMYRKHALIPDENRQAEIPVMKLYPAATVLIEARTEAKHVSIWPRWIIDENENPGWVNEFLTTDDRRESLFTYDDWIEQNKVQSFHVPAGLNLRVKLDTPYERQFCPIEIPQLIHLAQGQVLDLGRHDFKVALDVYVQVINSKSQAIEGVPVNVLFGGKALSPPHITDESGIARFSVVPYSVGEFRVICHKESGGFLKETIPFQIGGNNDSDQQFTLQLSDEIIEHLFKSDGL